MDTWCDVGQVFKIVDKVKSQIFDRKYEDFSVGKTWERKRERKREVQDLFRRSTEFRRLEFVRPRIKVHHLDEGYAHIPKGEISPNIQRRRVGEIKGFRLRRCS